MSTRFRTVIAALAATLSLTAGVVAPAVSQAQWHTLNVGGHLITHGNFTEGGKTPCERIAGELGKGLDHVGDYHEWIERKDAGEATAKEELDRSEGDVVRAQGESFEYGCDAGAPQ